ncbi:MAG: DUF2169 domain-containing protein [Myxococcales bacterium]|nr:DUF2169 domain-containing protein [Myxococcales bacterium]
MLVKNLTPYLHATKLTSRRPPRPEMMLVVKGTFALAASGVLEPLEDQPPLTAETYADDDVERAGECLYPGDFADFKLRAEVMLRGACHPPGERAVSECSVRLALGPVDKSLRVVGPRVWTDSLLGSPTTEPKPFRRMDLSYANALGGSRLPANPVGKGYKSDEAPNVEHAEEPLRSRSHRARPASFAPVSPGWPERAAKVGKEYGKRYRAERAPYYAEDFDWSYFQAAPVDQQVDGFLRGDELLELDNLHPSLGRVRVRLPGVRVRAFVNDVEQKLREVVMRLDTVFVDGDKSEVVLQWRGVEPVAEPDFLDVKTVLVASEPLASEPLAFAHYRALLLEFEDDPVGLKKLAPPGMPWFFDPAARPAAPEPEPGVDTAYAPLVKKLDALPDAQRAHVVGALKAVGAPPPEARAAIAQALARESSGSPPMPLPRKPGSLPSPGLKRKMRGVLAQVEKMKASFAGRQLSPEAAQKLAELEKLPFDPRWKQVDPRYEPPLEPVSTAEPGPRRDLSEQDLRGRDLRGIDLSGANLDDALLSHADLSGATLVGASLRGAVLWKTKLADADLSGADLTQANAAAAVAPRVILRGAVLELGFFEGADLTGADLGGATGEYPVFAKAELGRAKLAAAALPHADFTEAGLERASLVGASLPRATFEGCRGRGLDLSDADLTNARFQGADLSEARLVGARAARSYWAEARLDRADCSDARLDDAHLPQIVATAAKFTRASARGARFYRAVLLRAEFVDADLLGADFCRATLTDAQFTRANIYDGKFLEAAGIGCDFSGANLARSTLEPT